MKESLPDIFDMTNFWRRSCFKKWLKYTLCLGLSHDLTANKNRGRPIIHYLNKCPDIQLSITITPVYILHNLNGKEASSAALLILQVKSSFSSYRNKCSCRQLKEWLLFHTWSLFLHCSYKFQKLS